MSGKLGYITRRLLHNLITLWVVVTVIFLLFHALPGDPVDVLVDPLAGPEAREALKEQLGLNAPLTKQYLIYLRDLLSGHLGQSFMYRKPVWQLLGPAFFNTFILALLSFLVSYSVGSFLGIVLAWARGARWEKVTTAVIMLLRSAPSFWIGAAAIVLFSVRLDWFPLSGIRTEGYQAENFWAVYLSWDFIHHAVLPVLVGSLYFIGLPLLLVRNTMLEVIGEDYIEVARAKGVSPAVLLFKHAARNAIIPVLTSGALFIAWAMGGLVAIEYVFSWPGLGQQIVVALNQRDYPLAQGAFLLISVLIVVLNLLTDYLAAYLDPRIQLK